MNSHVRRWRRVRPQKLSSYDKRLRRMSVDSHASRRAKPLTEWQTSTPDRPLAGEFFQPKAEVVEPWLNLATMRRILVTGMSGTGKSSALAELSRLGFRVVDTDLSGWSEWSDADGGYVWREDRMTELLERHDGPSLYVSGTVSNQGRFYDRFDAVVLLSAPAEVLLSRINDRATNSYGKSPEERELIMRHLADVEPLLRRTCTHELDAAEPLANIVDRLAELGRDASA
jgi:shikimate kinase